ncbi:MAG: hypothetical protein WDO56_35065 [Gammaproteobacteria bacterium]
MSARLLVALALCVACSGCTTCREHPTACALASAVAAGCIVAGFQHHDSTRSHDYVLNDPKAPACTANGSCR